jgi:hypothetical protein
LGQIVDLRNKETCPCLKTFSNWDSAKLKESCILAYTNQMNELREVEQAQRGGEGAGDGEAAATAVDSKLMRTLRAELREVSSSLLMLLFCFFQAGFKVQFLL